MKKNIIILILLIIVVALSINLYQIQDKKVTNKKTIEEKETNTKSKDVEIENNNIEEKETEVINYVNNLDNEVETLTSKKTITKNDEKTLKNYFITLTDFIFYDGTIKGVKFSELTASVKEKVLSIYEAIDSKIESRFPNYKETIKDKASKTYNNLKEKTKELKDKVLEEYKEKVGEKQYNQTEQAYKDGIEDAKEVYDKYKPYIDEGKEKGKSALEKAKEKVSAWYKNYKEG